MVSVLASGAVDPGFELRLGQTNDNELGICCSSAKYAALRRKSKDWLVRNQNNVSSVNMHLVLSLSLVDGFITLSYSDIGSYKFLPFNSIYRILAHLQAN
jgi:hypothetical protein